jgi:mono/diheme cytochrome c family protein
MRAANLILVPVIAAVALYGQSRSAESGEAIFRLRCGGCHGLDGKAQTAIAKRHSMRDLTSPEVQRESDLELTRVIALGRGHMPAYEKILGDDGIRAVVGYIREMK